MTENKTITAYFKNDDQGGTNGNGGNTGNGGGSNGGNGGSTGKKINNPPVADLSAGEPHFGFINEEIEFNATYSYDIDDHISEYIWDFGDGTTANGKIINHSYSNPGDYKVILIVKDSKGATDTDESIVIVVKPNSPPSDVNITGPNEGLINVEYEFSFVSIDLDKDKIKYTIDWGDGTINVSDFLESGKSYTVKHKWTKPGEYLSLIHI